MVRPDALARPPQRRLWPLSPRQQISTARVGTLVQLAGAAASRERFVNVGGDVQGLPNMAHACAIGAS